MNLFELKRTLNLTIKNQFGWKTKRKIVVFSVDDYGNVRMGSKEARRQMQLEGLDTESNRFDKLDALEDAEDLEQLYDSLSSVKDKNGKSAIFTTFSLPANPNFEKIIASNYSEYFFETLSETHQKIKGYENVLELIHEGVEKKLIFPEFHGREHLNIKTFLELLRKKDKEILCAIDNKSYASISSKPFPNISYASAFGFESFSEVENHKKILVDGLNLFEEVYGYRARHFTAPETHAHGSLEELLQKEGIDFIDTDFIKREHQGEGTYKKSFNYLGKKNRFKQRYILRNCVYEPLLMPNLNWEDYCMKEIEIAFKFNKPANISSHRVNFSGHIESSNRDKGLKGLRGLLKKIVEKWPEVEFMFTREVGDLMNQQK